MLKYNNIELEWLGHATFLIKFQEKTIYFDPFVLPDNPLKADMILITHEHFDHCAPDKVKQIRKPNTIIVTNSGSAKKLTGDIKIIEAGQSIAENSIGIQAVPAYNVNKQFHPKGYGLGFIVNLGGTRVYHAGDTDLIPEMSNYKTDIALLPIGGTYTMNSEEAAKAAQVIKPKITIPMHFGFISGTQGNTRIFKEKLELGNLSVEILEPVVKPD